MIVSLFHQYHSDSDETLMHLILKRDERAFEELFKRYARTLQGFFWRRTQGQTDDAADLTQEVFLRVWDRADTYRPPTKVNVWLFSIAYNLLTDYYRRRGYKDSYISYLQSTEMEERDEDISIKLDQQQFDRALELVLATLSEAEKLLFDLRFTQELTVPEIAIVIGIPEGTVKSRIHTLTNKLRTKLLLYESI